MMDVVSSDEFFVEDEPLERIEAALADGRRVVTRRPLHPADQAATTAARFVVMKTSVGTFRFRMEAANGSVLATSEGYATKEAALQGIESVRASAADAAVEFAIA